MTGFVFLAVSRGQSGWGQRVEAGEPRQKVVGSLGSGGSGETGRAWPIVGEDGHLQKKTCCPLDGGHYNLL